MTNLTRDSTAIVTTKPSCLYCVVNGLAPNNKVKAVIPTQKIIPTTYSLCCWVKIVAVSLTARICKANKGNNANNIKTVVNEPTN